MIQAVPQADAPPIDDPATCGLALLGRDGRFEWLNPVMAGMLSSTLETLVGTHPDTLSTEVSAWFSREGQPFRWVNNHGEARWLLSQRHKIEEKTLLAVHDVTGEQSLREENKTLRQQLQDLRLNDDLTGLPNQRSIRQALELQISRSRRYNNPLSVVFVNVSLDGDQVELVQESADSLVLGVSRFLRDRLRWVDQIGRWDERVFLVLLPETSRDDAHALVEKIRSELTGFKLPSPLDGLAPALDFGVAVWEKGDDLRTLLQSAVDALADG